MSIKRKKSSKSKVKKIAMATRANRKSIKAPVSQESKADRLTSLRLPSSLARKIDEMATLAGISKSLLIKEGLERHIEFLFEKILNSSEDKKFIVLNAENFRRFSKALDDPSPPNKALVELMAQGPWKKP